jgi:hypothetical protein
MKNLSIDEELKYRSRTKAKIKNLSIDCILLYFEGKEWGSLVNEKEEGE